MSEQSYDAGDSHDADIDAGFDNAEERTAPAGVVGADPLQDEPGSSHDADVAAGYDDSDADEVVDREETTGR